jgi:hypothetical protein
MQWPCASVASRGGHAQVVARSEIRGLTLEVVTAKSLADQWEFDNCDLSARRAMAGDVLPVHGVKGWRATNSKLSGRLSTTRLANSMSNEDIDCRVR